MSVADISSREMGRLLNTAYDMRVIGDYEASVETEPEKAQQLLMDAKAFVEQVSDYLKQIQSGGNE